MQEGLLFAKKANPAHAVEAQCNQLKNFHPIPTPNKVNLKKLSEIGFRQKSGALSTFEKLAKKAIENGYKWVKAPPPKNRTCAKSLAGRFSTLVWVYFRFLRFT